MNIAGLEGLLTWLEAGAPETARVKGFDMEEGISLTSRTRHQFTGEALDECGAVVCMAGAVVAFNGLMDKDALNAWRKNVSWVSIRVKASVFLDLGFDTAKEFFQPRERYEHTITPAEAAITVRKLISTGQVDWSHLPNHDGRSPTWAATRRT